MADVSPLLDAFLERRLDLATFRHVEHVEVGFELVRRHDFPTAAAMFCGTLRRLTETAGKANVYHETLSLAFLSLIAERNAANPSQDFEAFKRDNSDLLDKSVLKRWYSPERLQSDVARRTFVLPQVRP